MVYATQLTLNTETTHPMTPQASSRHQNKPFVPANTECQIASTMYGIGISQVDIVHTHNYSAFKRILAARIISVYALARAIFN